MLANRAINKIIPTVSMPVTCHVAVWYWALQEISGREVGTGREVFERIYDLNPQEAMKNVRRSGQWDLSNKFLPTPPPGTVLFWANGPTHSAVITEDGKITGHNQGCIIGGTPMGEWSQVKPDQILPVYMCCYTIREQEILKAVKALV